MAVTQEQAELFLGAAMAIKTDLGEVSPDLLKKAVIIGAEMICELNDAFDALENESCNIVWNKPDSLPVVKEGEKRTYWVAVSATRRPRKGEPITEKLVFPAQYLNMPVEYDDDGDLLTDDCLVDIDGEPVAAIGWHTVRDHEDFDNYYPEICFNDDYVLLGWAEYHVPEFKGWQ